jgi:hypothetical protein
LACLRQAQAARRAGDFLSGFRLPLSALPMIPTSYILDALQRHVTALGLFDRVAQHQGSDLAEALEALRDPSAKLCFLVPGTDTWTHEIMPEYNAPLRSELRCEVALLISSQSVSYAASGDPAVLPLKDHLGALLIWENLGHPDLLVLPQTCEPLRIEWDDAPARTAWQLTLEIRQRINP